MTSRPSRPSARPVARGLLGPVLALVLLLGLVSVLASAPARAQVTLPESPVQDRGTAIESSFAVGDIDSVNLYNGNLTLDIPLGRSYPVDGELSFSLSLRYNSNVWDYAELCDSPDTGQGPQFTYFIARPNPLANAGLGWSVSLGRLLLAGEVFNEQRGPVYVAPDGSRHRFYAELHGTGTLGSQGGVSYTADGSYLRMKEMPAGACANAPAGQPACRHVEFPNGQVHEFNQVGSGTGLGDQQWLPTRIRDRFGNFVDVDYTSDLLTWTITDSTDPSGTGRVHRLLFTPAAGGNDYDHRPRRLDRIELASGTATPDEVVFTYEPGGETLPRQRWLGNDGLCDPGIPAGVQQAVTVDLLTRLTLPDGSFYTMDYWTDTVDDGFEGRASGSLSTLRLPTGGVAEWNYGRYAYPPGKSQIRSAEANFGVVRKRRWTEVGVYPSEAPGDVDVWTYDFEVSTARSPWDTQPGDPTDQSTPCYYETTVTDPLGHRVESFFQAAIDGFERLDALPFTVCHPDSGLLYDVDGDGDTSDPFEVDPTVAGTYGPRPEYFLSRRVWDGPTLVREEFVRYETDGSGPVGPNGRSDWQERLAYERTEYADDPVGGSPGGERHWVATNRINYDGFGNFRNTVVSSSFPDGRNGGRTFVDTNPNEPSMVPFTTRPNPPASRTWILDTHGRAEVGQADEETVAEFCFDPATGFLEGVRKLAGDTASASDVLVRYDRDAKGNRIGDRWYGGDAGSASGSGCDEPGGSPVEETRYAWVAGSLAAAWVVEPCSGADFLSLADHTVDPVTGEVIASRDPSGIETLYEYDALGRVVAEHTQGSGSVYTRYAMPGAAATQGPLVSRWIRAEGSGAVSSPPSGCPGAGDPNQVGLERWRFDGLGRVVLETRCVAQGAGSRRVERRTAYNGKDWVIEKSVWSPAGQSGSAAVTERLGFDRFGRPATVVQPDGRSASFEYVGDRITRRTVQIGGFGAATTVETRDAKGRLIGVGQPEGGGTRTTSYAYDELDRLSHVCVDDGDLNPRACPGQQRTFEHDGRGFLVRETLPESGTFVFGRDVQGREILFDAPGTGFDLLTTRDAAGRATEVRTLATGELVEQRFYGRVDDGTDRRTGKLVETRRHNRILVPTGGGTGAETVIATERFSYAGRGGRLSAWTVRTSVGGTFTGEIPAYDDLGQALALVYPTCARPPCAGVAPERTLEWTRRLGALTAIPEVIDAISYHDDGSRDTVDHANDTALVHRRTADNWRLRGIDLQGPSGPLWSTDDYAYDAAGHVTDIGAREFVYDGVGRLLSGEVETAQGEVTQSATYDRFGNLTSLVASPDLGPGSVGAIAVDPVTNRLAGGVATYDDVGNVLTLDHGGQTSTYARGPLREIHRLTAGTDDRSFVYTASGQRLVTYDLVTGDETWTLRGPGDEVLRRMRVEDGVWTWVEDYVVGDGPVLAAIDGAGTRHFHHDHLGSVRRITDEEGVVVERRDDLPFGGYAVPYEPGAEEIRFTGHERDAVGSEAAHLDYMGARYTSPWYGRFLSTDPAPGSVGSPESWNRYTYALNNPVAFLDPDGRQPRAWPEERIEFFQTTPLIAEPENATTYSAIPKADIGPVPGITIAGGIGFGAEFDMNAGEWSNAGVILTGEAGVAVSTGMMTGVDFKASDTDVGVTLQTPVFIDLGLPASPSIDLEASQGSLTTSFEGGVGYSYFANAGLVNDGGNEVKDEISTTAKATLEGKASFTLRDLQNSVTTYINEVKEKANEFLNRLYGYE